MPKLKMRTTYGSPERILHPGQIYNFSAEEAKELLAGGFAEEPDDSTTEVRRHNAIRRSQGEVQRAE